MNDIELPKVVRVTRTEFELSDGQVFQHVVELDEVPTVEEFQEFYDRWRTLIEPKHGNETAYYGRNVLGGSFPLKACF